MLPGEDVKAAVREYAMDKVQVDVRDLRPLRAQRPRRAGQGRGRRALCRAVRGPRSRGWRRAVRPCRRKSCAATSSTRACVPTAASSTEVRPIWCEVGVLPRPHGSAVFTRGQTQVMTVATLAPVSEKQIHGRHRHRGLQALYAPLQLPRLFHRRSQAHAQPGPPRDRPRRSGRARAGADDPARWRSSPTACGWSPRSCPPTAPPRRRASAVPPWR